MALQGEGRAPAILPHAAERSSLLPGEVLVEDALGGVERGVGGDGDVGCDACTLPGGTLGRVGVGDGDAEEQAALAHAERHRRVGASGRRLADDHGAAETLHDEDELLGRSGGHSARQDEKALLGPVALT